MDCGTTSFGGYSSEELLKVEVEVVENSECLEDPLELGYPVTDDMIYASRFGKGSCHGDSGGPLTMTDRTQKKMFSLE